MRSDFNSQYICPLRLLAFISTLWICMCLPVTMLSGQHVNMFNYDTENGLPSSEVYDSHQASNGMLWFSSDRGVFTYNGYQFSTYTTHSGLGNNTNFSIFEDSKKTLWFTGYNGTVTQYKNGKFEVHKTISDFVRNNYPFDWISFIEFDETHIYFALTKNKRLFCYHIPTQQIVPFTEKSKAAEPDMLKIGQTLYFINDRKFAAHGYLSNQLSKLFFISDSDGIYSSRNYIYHIRKDKGKWIKDSLNIYGALQSKNICIANAERAEFCVSSIKGLLLFRLEKNKLQYDKIAENENLTSIIKDKEGNYWCTSTNKGIFKMPSIAIFKELAPELEGKKINAVTTLNQLLIAGSNTSDLFFIKNHKTIAYFGEMHKQSPIEQVKPVSDNILFANVFYYLNKASNSVQKSTKNGYGYYYTAKDSNSFFIGDNNYIQYFQGFNSPKLMFHSQDQFESIKSLHYSKNRLWIGTINNLFSAGFKNNSLTDIVNYGKIHPLLSNRINDIKSFRSGFLLAVFGNGLVYFDGNVPTLIKSTVFNKNDLINRVLPINNSAVLLCTNNGLILYKFKPDNFDLVSEEIFNIDDGLSSNFINDACISGNRLWLATNKGINFVSIEQLSQSHTAPFVQITGLKTQDSFINYAQHIELEYSQNSFQTEFVGICFRKPNRKDFYKYAFVEENKDTLWFYTNEGKVQYTNIAPGKYTFLVTARNKNNDWAPYQITHITIHPPFVQTIWFKLIIILIIGLLVYTIIRYRINQIRVKSEEQKALERLKHYAQETELRSLRNQMNPHFIFNSLNSIQRYIITNHFTEANAYITKFARLMRDSLSMSKLESITLNKELEFIANYLDLEKLRFENLFEYKIIVEDDLDLIMTKIPSLLLQPLLENSIKHGFKNYSNNGFIQIQILNWGEKHYQIRVTDNGKGIENIEEIMSDQGQNNSFGVGLVMQRIKLLKERHKDNEISFKLENAHPGVIATIVIPKSS